jgi:hypothetical protein
MRAPARCLLVSTLAAATARAQDVDPERQACADAYVEAQRLKKDGKLLAAREALVTCARDACLAAVKKDCVGWLDEVNAALPSVVIVALGPDGAETTAVRVFVDGEPFAEQLDGRARELDPGEHRLRFEHAGAPAREQKLLLREGQKHREIRVSFRSAPARADAPAAAADATPPGPDEPAPIPVAAWVLGGVGVAAIAGAGFFWLSAEGKKGELDDSGCAPRCDEADVDAVRRQRLFGDIALGVGVASLGVATYLVVSRPRGDAARSATRLELRPVPGGMLGALTARF